MLKETKNTVRTAVMAGIIMVCGDYLHEFHGFMQASFTVRIILAMLMGVIVVLISEGVAYFMDTRTEAGKERCGPSFWKYAIANPKKGRGRRAFAGSLSAMCMTAAYDYGHFPEINIVLRIAIAGVAGLIIGVLVSAKEDLPANGQGKGIAAGDGVAE